VPQLVTGLWLGYDNNKETKSTSAVAVVAWADYMGPILKDLPVRPFPPKPQLAGKFDPLKSLKPKPKPEAATPVPKPAEERNPTTTEPAPLETVIPEGTPSEPNPPANPAPAAPVVAPPAPPPPLPPAGQPAAPPPLP
jgi:penicillin-binding protein 1A